MDLARHLLELMAPAKVGDSLAPGARWTGISTELGLRLVVDLGGVDVLVEVDPVDPARPFAVRTQHFAVSYRGVDANAPPDVKFSRVRMTMDMPRSVFALYSFFTA